ncbi:MAG: Hpt domain-containing protein [Cyanobacteria bacterium P01_F01_bin.153]
MGSENEQVVKFFIMEAKEHLESMESALDHLDEVVHEYEECNTVYRNAHTIKGGAAMLGYESIRRVSLMLENCFKHLREHPATMDARCQKEFTMGVKLLATLISKLEGGGYDDDSLGKAVDKAEPTLTALYDYVKDGTSSSAAKAALPPNFSAQVMAVLKKMVVIFKQPPSPKGRKQLDLLCRKLIELGQGNAAWTKLIETTQGAIANPKVSPSAMAPLVVRELKQGSELMAVGKGDLLSPSEALTKLAVPVAAGSAPVQTSPAGDQLTMPRNTKAVAKTLIGAFSKPQLMEIAKYLAMAAKKP